MRNGPPLTVAIFCHSLFSCWNHGNAHFLRGIVRDLQAAGHEVRVFEPEAGWSRTNLATEAGPAALEEARSVFPAMQSELYAGTMPDLDRALDGVDLVLVHEWSEPGLVAEIGRRRAAGGRFTLLFHDTHHRAVSEAAAIGALKLDGYDGVLAFGQSLEARYRREGWGARVWTWHEAADTALFHPQPDITPDEDLIWIGNWGDGERTQELHDFLLAPARRLGLRGSVHGVRYPAEAQRAVAEAGLVYRGWVANHRAPALFARHRLTVHVPRRPYLDALPGIPTIRVFEALACGLPLVIARWRDAEGLFDPDSFLIADDTPAMQRHMRAVLNDEGQRRHMVERGLTSIRARHTTAHRVAELMGIYRELNPPVSLDLGRAAVA